MKACDQQHDAIVVHTDRNCPLCAAQDKIAELEARVDELKNQVADYRDNP